MGLPNSLTSKATEPAGTGSTYSYSVGIWRKRNGSLWFWDLWNDTTDTKVAEAKRGLDSVEDAQFAASEYCEAHNITATTGHPTII